MRGRLPTLDGHIHTSYYWLPIIRFTAPSSTNSSRSVHPNWTIRYFSAVEAYDISSGTWYGYSLNAANDSLEEEKVPLSPRFNTPLLFLNVPPWGSRGSTPLIVGVPLGLLGLLGLGVVAEACKHNCFSLAGNHVLRVRQAGSGSHPIQQMSLPKLPSMPSIYQ